MQEPLISIVTPVYNVASYLRRCLDSLISQTYRNLEFVVVDDGSTDGSGDICDEYARRDRRFKAIHHGVNRGAAVAYNTALRNLGGDFIAFVDGDDWIEPDMYTAMLKRQQRDGVDVVVCGYSKDYPDGRCEPMTNERPVSVDVFDAHQALYYTFRRDAHRNFGGYLWNRLYRHSLFNGLGADESLFFSDALLSTSAALCAESFAYLPGHYYHYYQREGSSVSSQRLNPKPHVLKSYAHMLALLEQHGGCGDILPWVKRFYSYWASRLLEFAIEQRDAGRVACYQREVRRYLPEYLATNQEHPDRIERINWLLKVEIDEEARARGQGSRVAVPRKILHAWMDTGGGYDPLCSDQLAVHRQAAVPVRLRHRQPCGECAERLAA